MASASAATHAHYPHLSSLNDPDSSPSDDNNMLIDSDADNSPPNNVNNGHLPLAASIAAHPPPRHALQQQTSTDSDLDADANAEADPDFDDDADAQDVSYSAPGGANPTSVRLLIPVFTSTLLGPNMFLPPSLPIT